MPQGRGDCDSGGIYTQSRRRLDSVERTGIFSEGEVYVVPAFGDMHLDKFLLVRIKVNVSCVMYICMLHHHLCKS
jgi:hypothetical protein